LCDSPVNDAGTNSLPWSEVCRGSDPVRILPNAFAPNAPLFALHWLTTATKLAEPAVPPDKMKAAQKYPKRIYMDYLIRRTAPCFPQRPSAEPGMQASGMQNTLARWLSVSRSLRGGLPFPFRERRAGEFGPTMLNYQGPLNGGTGYHKRLRGQPGPWSP